VGRGVRTPAATWFSARGQRRFIDEVDPRKILGLARYAEEATLALGQIDGASAFFQGIDASIREEDRATVRRRRKESARVMNFARRPVVFAHVDVAACFPEDAVAAFRHRMSVGARRGEGGIDCDRGIPGQDVYEAEATGSPFIEVPPGHPGVGRFGGVWSRSGERVVDAEVLRGEVGRVASVFKRPRERFAVRRMGREESLGEERLQRSWLIGRLQIEVPIAGGRIPGQLWFGGLDDQALGQRFAVSKFPAVGRQPRRAHRGRLPPGGSAPGNVRVIDRRTLARGKWIALVGHFATVGDTLPREDLACDHKSGRLASFRGRRATKDVGVGREHLSALLLSGRNELVGAPVR
jgi:hypothetical protein